MLANNNELRKITDTYITDYQKYFRMCCIESDDVGIVFYIKKIFSIYCLTLHVVLLLLDWSQTEKISDSSFLVIVATTYIYVGITVLQWYSKRDEILKKIRNVDKFIIFTNESIMNIVNKDNKYRKTITKLIFISINFLVVAATVVWLFELLFDYEKYYKIIENDGNVTTRKYTQRFVVQIWTPFDSTASRINHFVTVIFTLIPFVFLTISICGCDAIFIGLTTYAFTHFKFLKYILENITKPETDIIIASEDSNLKSEQKINNAVAYLDHLLDFCKSLRSFYDFLILFQIFWAICFFSVTLISVSHLPSTDPMFIVDGLTMVVGTVDRILFFCYYGNELTVTAGEVHVALYNSNWIAESASFKKSLLMMMIRMEKPVILTIGGVLPLTLQTFVEILRAGYTVALLTK